MLENLGIVIPGLVRFVTQVGFAVAGAASLWGLVFILESRKSENSDFEKFSGLLVKLFTVSLLIFLVAWFLGALVFYPPDAAGHEGIRIMPEDAHLKAGFRTNFPLVIILAIVGFFNLRLFLRNRNFWNRHSPWLWFSQFLLLSAIAIFAIYTGRFDKYQLFHAFHNWHSILTLGSVVVVDFLFLATTHLHSHKKTFYNFFHLISAFIWIGLGLDFLSNFLILEEGFKLTEQFFFTQTVIAVIIINGALLSGRITEVLQFLARAGKTGRDATLTRLISISGAVSIVSWTTITFVDFFELTLNYWQMFGAYAALIAIAYFVHHMVRFRMEKKIF